MKKKTIFLLIFLTVFISGVSAENRRLHFSGYFGIVYPESDIRENYSGKTVFGGGVFYNLKKVNITADYLYYSSKDFTSYTKTPAKLQIHHIFVGAELPLFGEKKNQFIGAGASFNSLNEEVGDLGSFKNNNAATYISGGIRIPIKKKFIGLKMIYNFLKIKGTHTGGFFLMVSAGF
jgi:hypothetical protein